MTAPMTLPVAKTTANSELRDTAILEMLRRSLVTDGVPHFCNDNISPYVLEEHRAAMLSVVSSHVSGILDALLIDHTNDHNTKDTPNRVAKMMVNEIFGGRYDKAPDNTDFPNVKEMDQLLVQGPCDVKSTCAHHLVPFVGSAWIGILPSPKGVLTGLSKYARIVDHYSRRPQIQEELNAQIAHHIQELLEPAGLIVVLRAKHFCMKCRGVNQSSWTTTSMCKGAIKDNPSLKSEFFALAGPLDVEI